MVVHLNFSLITHLINLFRFFLSSLIIFLMNFMHLRNFLQFDTIIMKFSGRFTRLLDKRNLILMVVRMPNQDFINVHDNHKSYTRDYHCERQVLIWVQTWGGRQWSFNLSKIGIKSCDGLRDDVQHCNRDEQTARKSHGYWHDLTFTETLKVWDKSAKNDHF